MDRRAGGFDPPLRVFVAEDPADGETVARAVGEDGRLALVGSAPNAAAAVARTVELAPDVLVVDTGLPGGAIGAVLEIRARMPAVQLVLTYRDGDAAGDHFLDALSAGAYAYADHAAPAALTDAIVDVAAGEVILTRAQTARVVEELRDRTRPRRRLAQQPALTAREWQVLELMYNELSTPEIAELLVLSPVTVRSHARSIRHKLDAQRGRDALRR